MIFVPDEFTPVAELTPVLSQKLPSSFSEPSSAQFVSPSVKVAPPTPNVLASPVKGEPTVTFKTAVYFPPVINESGRL